MRVRLVPTVLRRNIQLSYLAASLLAVTLSAGPALAMPPTEAPKAGSPTNPPPIPSTPADANPQAESTPVAPKEKVKTGVIAASIRTGEHAAIDVDTSGDAPGDDSNAISASISRAGKDTCVARVINNGKLTYSISFNVIGVDSRGSKPLNQYYSATIKPKQTVEKQVQRCDQGLNLSVDLKSAKAMK